MTPGRGGKAALLGAGLAATLAVGLFGGYAWRVEQERRANAARLGGRTPDVTQARNYRDRLTHFRTLPTGATTVMLGDSLTANAQWNELLGPEVANRGIGGDTTLGVLARLDAVPPSAKRVFLMIGLNDLTDFRASPEDTAQRTARVVQGLKGREVYLQSVLYTRSARSNGKIRRLNAMNRAFCEGGGGCRYLDLNAGVMQGDALPADLTHDGRHLNGEGYRRWAGVVRPLLTGEPMQ